MREDAFRHFLATVYRTRTGTRLLPNTVNSTVADCRRVESVLDVNLDHELRALGRDPESFVEQISRRAERFNIRSATEHQERKVLANLHYAARRYAEFLRSRG